MNRLRLIKTTYTALAALMLAACASDELTDGTVQDLPEGMYPLQIAGVSITVESNAEPWGRILRRHAWRKTQLTESTAVRGKTEIR